MERKVNIRCHKTECFPRECFRFSAPSLLCLLRREEREQEPWPPIHPSLAHSLAREAGVRLFPAKVQVAPAVISVPL